jgi:hypothetical protein
VRQWESERTCIVCWIHRSKYAALDAVDVKESETDLRESLTQNMPLGRCHDNRRVPGGLTYCESK